MSHNPFGRPIHGGYREPCRCLYDVRFQTVDIALKPGELEVGASRWGTGSEFAADASGDLSQMTLDVAPYSMVDPLPPEQFNALAAALAVRAEPGGIELIAEHAVVAADSIWLGHPFGRAIWSFEFLPAEPLEFFEARLENVDIVRTCSNLLVGVKRRTCDLAVVYAEGFEANVRMPDGGTISLDQDPDLVDLLGQVNYAFFADPDLAVGEANPIESLLLDPNVPREVRSVVSLLIDQLNAEAAGAEDESL